MNANDQKTSVVISALETCTDAVAPAGHRYWNCYLGTEAFTARIDDDWLLLRNCSVSDQLDRESLWQLLQWNAQLPGGVKFALIGLGSLAQARAEIPLNKGTDLSARVQHACVGFRAAAEGMDRLSLGVRDSALTDPSMTHEEIARLCEEAGWPSNQDSKERCTVDLETSGGFHRALVRSNGRTQVSVEMASSEAITPTCQEALALFLLKTGRQLRLVRPTIQQIDGRVSAYLEVVFEQVPTAQELGHTFAALSLGCRLAASEAAALLEDETLAQECLSMWKVDRLAVQPRPVGKINHLTRASNGAEKGSEEWIPQ